MATVVKRTVRGIAYYYLEHTVREDGKVTKKSRYLGRAVPKDIGRLKQQFVYELDKEKWFVLFDKIKESYTAEQAETPRSAREKELKEFSVRFTYNTQRIEGSTLTLRETAQLLEEGISPSGKSMEDVKEAEAHQKVFFDMLSYRKDLSLQVVLHWHKGLFEETKPDIAGQIRRHGVRISGSKFIPPSPVELNPLLRQFFGWYIGQKAKMHPVEFAALVHLRFVTVHPFSDGNGRISRLLMNFILNKHGYPMLNIEYKGRRTYYNALERAQINNNERAFCLWFFKKYIREQKSHQM
ncbi:MAG: Fic family protein [Thaumarchaeota archaeon]|nr:Fic family protein [Nitrososphaerota archaeon]MCL5317942.1 Fic family protein [Nitrososphaerota archaeon]